MSLGAIYFTLDFSRWLREDQSNEGGRPECLAKLKNAKAREAAPRSPAAAVKTGEKRTRNQEWAGVRRIEREWAGFLPPGAFAIRPEVPTHKSR
jgi:hypothetical protein